MVRDMFTKLRTYLELMKASRAAGHIPVWRQAAEMAVLQVTRRLGPGYYLMGEFGDPQIRLEDKLQYYGGKAYRKRVYELNSPRYAKMSQHKMVEASILRFFALPTPEAYGYFHPGRGRTTDGNPLRTSRDLARLLEERRISRFVMKPSEGMEGRGFVAAERMSDGRIRRIDAEDSESVEAFVEARLSLPGGYLMQAYVVQHPELAEVNPTSLNTVRMYTFQPRGERPRCLGGFLRIGRTGSLVDNLHQGGLFSVVDLETGTLGMARRSIPSSQLLEHHPDSGARIAGRVLPFWPEARALCEAALEAFPYIRFAGLDIGFSAEGPLVIEMNVEPGYRGFARIRCPSVRALSDRGRD